MAPKITPSGDEATVSVNVDELRNSKDQVSCFILLLFCQIRLDFFSFLFSSGKLNACLAPTRRTSTKLAHLRYQGPSKPQRSGLLRYAYAMHLQAFEMSDPTSATRY